MWWFALCTRDHLVLIILMTSLQTPDLAASSFWTESLPHLPSLTNSSPKSVSSPITIVPARLPPLCPP